MVKLCKIKRNEYHIESNAGSNFSSAAKLILEKLNSIK